MTWISLKQQQWNYYRVEVEDRGADKYVYVAENGEMLQMKLKNYA